MTSQFFIIRIHNGIMLACSVFKSGHGDNWYHSGKKKFPIFIFSVYPVFSTEQ